MSGGLWSHWRTNKIGRLVSVNAGLRSTELAIEREPEGLRMQWPEWWDWELELTPHLEKRMEDRDCTEIDLREMLERANGYRPDVVEGRWVIETRHRRASWEVIVETDFEEELLVVITAYPVER